MDTELLAGEDVDVEEISRYEVSVGFPLTRPAACPFLPAYLLIHATIVPPIQHRVLDGLVDDTLMIS